MKPVYTFPPLMSVLRSALRIPPHQTAVRHGQHQLPCLSLGISPRLGTLHRRVRHRASTASGFPIPSHPFHAATFSEARLTGPTLPRRPLDSLSILALQKSTTHIYQTDWCLPFSIGHTHRALVGGWLGPGRAPLSPASFLPSSRVDGII